MSCDTFRAKKPKVGDGPGSGILVFARMANATMLRRRVSSNGRIDACVVDELMIDITVKRLSDVLEVLGPLESKAKSRIDIISDARMKVPIEAETGATDTMEEFCKLYSVVE